MFVWELAWADSAMVVLHELSSYRGSRISRLNCIWIYRIWANLGEMNIKTIFLTVKENRHFVKLLQYPFKQYKNMLKNMTVSLYTYFYNISLNVLRPTFFNIYILPFLCSPNIGKISAKVGPKNNYFSYILSSCNNRIIVFNIFFFMDM